MTKKTKTLLSGAVLLSLASMFTKVLSAAYKVPFQNLTGNQGFYVYQQIYPLYGLAASFSLNGLPIFISKLISETNSNQEAQKQMMDVFYWVSLLSLGIFAVLFFGSSGIAQLMGDTRLSPVIQSVSYTFLLVPFLASLRGYFQGKMDMGPTAYSKVVEQIIRVTILLGVALLFTTRAWNVYEMGRYAYMSAWISGLVAFGLLMYIFWKKEEKPRLTKITFTKVTGSRLLFEGLEITAISSLMILFQFVDSFTVYNGLLNYGYSNSVAMSLKGVYDRALPLVQVGLVLGLVFSTSLLPLMRKDFVSGNFYGWKRNAVSILRLTLVFSGASTVGLIAVLPWLNHFLFQDALGSLVIQIYLTSIIFASMILSIHSIIQSQGKKNIGLLALGVGLLVKAAFNELVVSWLGLIGSSLLTVLSLIITLLVLSKFISKDIYIELAKERFWLKLLLALAILGVIVRGLLHLITSFINLTSRFTSFGLTGLGVVVGVCLFMGLIIKWNLLDEEELQEMPFYSLIKRIGDN